MIGYLHPKKRKPLNIETKQNIFRTDSYSVHIWYCIPTLYQTQIDHIFFKGDENLFWIDCHEICYGMAVHQHVGGLDLD